MGKQSRSGIDQTKYANLKSRQVTDLEALAKSLHEAGRQAVLANKVVKKDGAPIGQIKFIEWEELSEDAKEGRRIQATFLLGKYEIYRKE